MKELHNHIFSNTTCISKELMMKYINKQLTKNELHEIEKHLLDCDLCTDAITGMKYAKNNSILMAIDNKIDAKISGKNTSFFRNRWLMAAASLIAIIFGVYLLTSLFNQNNFSTTEMAVLTEKEESKPLNEKTTTIVEEQNNIEINDAKNDVVIEKEVYNKNSTTRNTVNEIALNEKTQAKDEPYTASVDENAVADKEATHNEYRIENSVSQPSTPTTENTMHTLSVTDNANDVDVNFNEENTAKEKNKAAKRSKVTNSSYATLSASVEAKSDKSYQNTYYLHGNKVVDYRVEYQNEADFKKQAATNGTPADFPNQQQKAEAEKALEKLVIEETYIEVLDRAMLNLNNSIYKQALADFNLILTKHALDVNAQFYGGLSAYHLKNYKNALTKFDAVLKNTQTEFNQEAKWYKALTLIELKENKKAKKVLEEIINANGFYRDKAEEKLKLL